MKSNSTQDLSLNQSTLVYLLIRQTADLINQELAYELRSRGCVPEIQTALLFVVKTLGEQASPSEISRLMLRQRHSTSQLLDRMIKRGLLKKTKDIRRKNAVRLLLTAKGEEALQNALFAREIIERIVGALSDKEINCLMGHLQKLRSEAIELQTARTRSGYEDLGEFFHR